MGITNNGVKAKQRFVVITSHGVRHPFGTLVEIEDRCSYGLYCKAVGGQTAYWYEEDELMTDGEFKGEQRNG